jgi:hypothetical protein
MILDDSFGFTLDSQAANRFCECAEATVPVPCAVHHGDGLVFHFKGRYSDFDPRNDVLETKPTLHCR